MANDQRYPPISHYGLISDCHCAALVSCDGSIDWCCMPRIDDDSCFGRLLDWEHGGYCRIAPAQGGYETSRRYAGRTMILETRFRNAEGEVLLTDFFARGTDGPDKGRYRHIRIVDGVAGDVAMRIEVAPRFDYGQTVPYVDSIIPGVYSAIGSNKGMLVCSEAQLRVDDGNALVADIRVAAGRRLRLMLQFAYPETIDEDAAHQLPDAARIDDLLERTRAWWAQWSAQVKPRVALDEHTLRSSLVLKSLTFDRTGAIAAAATTSLPEQSGGSRNWDYRFSWVRDSVFAVRALHELGYHEEADRFHRFIRRSAAGNAEQMQIMYGVDGKRRLTEIELDWLEGYRGSAPVRIGNRAARQLQLDVYGELMEMAWDWEVSGHRTDLNYWNFLSGVADLVCDRWESEDRGIWEVRGDPQHYVHSKVMCWAALNRGLMLAERNGFDAPLERWKAARERIRKAVETRGYDRERGVFVQAFDTAYLDAALLLLPRTGFVAWDDPRMLRTADAICTELERNGLLLRYNAPDGLPGPEGAFLPCTFWLVACLAQQGRRERARSYYLRALECSNELGLFSEEFDIEAGEMLGNFPQALTHVSQVTAKLALETWPSGGNGGEASAAERNGAGT